MFNILDMLPTVPAIKVIDVGAMWLGEGKEPYYQLMQRNIANIVGFEPIQAQCDRLNAMAMVNYTYLPYFIGDGRPGTFHECNFPATSSLHEPNTALLDKFQNLENLTQVVRTEQVQTKRLDDIPEVAEADYLKVDVQGGEVAVYAGAEKLLEDTLIVHTEVEFVPMYRDQPLFAEVDQILRRNGFLFHRFHSISGRVFKPLIFQENINSRGSQMLWADAVYVKDFMALERLSKEKLLKLAVILHEVYKSYDLCYMVLGHYDDKAKTGFKNEYHRRLVQPGV